MLNSVSKILYVLQGKKSTLTWLVLLFVLTSVLEAVGIGLIGPFIHIISTPETLDELSFITLLKQYFDIQNNSEIIFVLGLILVVLFLVKSILFFIGKSYIHRYAYNQRKLLIAKLLNTYLKVPYTFHLSRNSANYIHNITIETYHFVLKCLIPLLELIANSVVTVTLLLLLANTSLTLLLVVFLIISLLFSVFNLLGKNFRKWGRLVTESNQEIAKTVNHSLGGLKETRIIGCEDYFGNEIDYYGDIFARSAALFRSFQDLPRISLESILTIGIVIALMASNFLFEDSFEDTIAILSIFLVAAARLLPAISQSLQSIGNMKNFGYALDILYSDLKALDQYYESNSRKFLLPRSTVKHDRKKHDHKVEHPIPFDQCIQVRNLSYQYPGSSDYAIRDISFDIKKGQSIAFIGKSGAGKTTLIDIILGLLEATDGDIMVDGKSVYENLRSYQQLLAYIPQSIYLTDETIEQNIAFGVEKSKISYEKINQVIQAAQLEELIESLPEGIHTKVGERGVRLSGGQRQRIGIARALYHGREILVLDEATSALDSETEQRITESIDALAGSKTLIIVSHRLSTIKNCDRIYMLDRGEIVDSGNYQQIVGEVLAN